MEDLDLLLEGEDDLLPLDLDLLSLEDDLLLDLPLDRRDDDLDLDLLGDRDRERDEYGDGVDATLIASSNDSGVTALDLVRMGRNDVDEALDLLGEMDLDLPLRPLDLDRRGDRDLDLDRRGDCDGDRDDDGSSTNKTGESDIYLLHH